MPKSFLIAALLFAAFITGCTEGTSVPDGPLPITGSKFIPFATGNYWIYRVQGFSPDGSRYTDLLDTLNATAINKVRGYEAIELLEQNMNSYIYYFDGDTTFQMQTSKGSTDTSLSILGVNSMNDGDELLFKDVVNADNTILRHVLRQDTSEAKISYSFEEFTCYKMREMLINGTVSTPDTNQMLVSYFALGKGLIRQETYFSNPATGHPYLAVTLDLNSYLVQ